jgi:inhibitor of KinA
MRFEPLGDQAVLARCPDENAATVFAGQVRAASLPWTVDVVQAYGSIAVYYDLTAIDFHRAAQQLAQMEKTSSAATAESRTVTIPCCYELGLDWSRLEEHTGLAAEDVIRLHCQTTYTVYAIGFCPGFPYLGYLPEAIASVPRLATPRLKVAEGSVGLTGRQTGIYTQERPGGWNIVGRTPLQLVDVADGYFPLRTGDQVRFERIDKAMFKKLAGKRLPESSVQM